MNATPPRGRAVPKHAVSLASRWGVVAATLAVAMGCAITIGTDQAGLPRAVGFLAGTVVAALAVGALPSVPTRTAVVGVIAMGGFVVARHARVAGADGLLVLGWAAAVVVTIALAERAHHSEQTQLDPSARPWSGAGRSATAVLLTVLLVAAFLAPLIGAAMHHDVRRGDDADSSRDPISTVALRDRPQLDMRSRPRLSDRIVMTVDADHAAFWRGATYDTWDGVQWARSNNTAPFLLDDLGRGVLGVRAPPDDPAANNGVVNRQTVTIEASYAQVVFAAATPQQIRTDRAIGQFADATLETSPEFANGRGSTYTVVSREARSTPESLRASATRAVPRGIAAQYAQPAAATARVRALARMITATANTPYDKVLAIERWLGSHTKYSLDAPLPPDSTADVVDWFVFHSKRGWCEQIASTLVVMLREVGVPSRLATGFATGDSDRVTGRFTVRERDAHAWAEVFFPGVGWQGFDPTAAVPLAGTTPKSPSLFGWLNDHAVVLLAGAALLAALWLGAGPLGSLIARRRRRAQATWAARTLEELEAVGRGHDRPRQPHETPRGYAAALAARLARPDLEAVGEQIDVEAFAPDGVAPPGRERAERALAAARDC